MSLQELTRRSVQGLLVALGATGLRYAIAFGTQIVLARMLEPADFGVLAFAGVVATLCYSVTNLSADKYVIKENNDIQHKLDSGFTLELILAAVLAPLLVLTAPSLMTLLAKPHLTGVVQLLALSCLYVPLSVPRALFEKDLRFLPALGPMIAAHLIAGLVAISLARLGFGVWSLVWWRLTAFAGEIIILWCIAPYRPKVVVDWNVMKDILRFGAPLLGSGILVFYYWNVDYYIVGRLLGEEQLGYYWLGFQASHYFLQARTTIISVVFPTFAKMARKEDMKAGFEALTRLTFVAYLLPTIVVLALGRDLVSFVFGSKWAPAATALQVSMVLVTLRAVLAYWDPVLLNFGRSRVLFVMTLLNSIFITGLGYFATRQWGIEGMAWAVLLSTIVVAPFGAIHVKRLIGVSYTRLLGPPLAVGLGLAVPYFLFGRYALPLIPAVWGGVSVLGFGIVYLTTSWFANRTLLHGFARSMGSKL